MLDPQQPEAAKEFDQAKCLNFHYVYPVLPPGLLPRFIVRTHVLSEEHRWKTGVILNFEGNTALVKADAQEKTIRILISGPAASRRRMLAMMRQDFDVIHSDTPHLKPDELVSFPQHPLLTVSYAKLEVCVLPIIIRPTHAWKKLPAGKLLLGSLNALPSSGKTIPEWKTGDAGWVNVAAGVERAAAALRIRKTPL